MISHTVVFWIIFAALLFIIIFCDQKYNMLRDVSTASVKPYSWSRVQLAWWVLVVLSAFITIICSYAGHPIPTLDSSTLILLGITAGTTAAARLIDVSDKQNPNLGSTLQDQSNGGFFLDILSDCNGVSMNRLQAVIFNFVFGVWFIGYVLGHFTDPFAGLSLTLKDAVLPAINGVQPTTMAQLTALKPEVQATLPAVVKDCLAQPWNYIIPVISQNNLILLGLSSATYAALKSTENTPAKKNTNAPAANQPPAPQANDQQPVPGQPDTDQPVTS